MTFWVPNTVVVSRSHATWWHRLVSATCFTVKRVRACAHDRVHARVHEMTRISLGQVPEAGNPAESEAVKICFHFQLSLLAAASGLQGAIFDTSRSLCGKSQRAALLHIALARQPDGSKAKHVVHQEKKEPLLLLFVLFLMWKSHPVGMEQLLTAASARAKTIVFFPPFLSSSVVYHVARGSCFRTFRHLDKKQKSGRSNCIVKSTVIDKRRNKNWTRHRLRGKPGGKKNQARKPKSWIVVFIDKRCIVNVRLGKLEQLQTHTYDVQTVHCTLNGTRTLLRTPTHARTKVTGVRILTLCYRVIIHYSGTLAL